MESIKDNAKLMEDHVEPFPECLAKNQMMALIVKTRTFFVLGSAVNSIFTRVLPSLSHNGYVFK